MSEDTPTIPDMPDRSQRVREALLRFDSANRRPSSMLSLDDAQLFEVGLLLSDRAMTVSDAWRTINAKLGPDEDGDEAIPRSTFYRFADRFKALLAQVTAEYAQRRVRLSVADVTDDNIRNMTRLSRHRFVELLAEKLINTNDLAEIDRYMSKMASVLADAERAQHADEKLELDQLNYERRLSETKARLDLAEQRVLTMQQDAEIKRERIEDRLTRLQSRLDVLSKRASRGERITEDQLRHAGADLEAVRGEMRQGVAA